MKIPKGWRLMKEGEQLTSSDQYYCAGQFTPTGESGRYVKKAPAGEKVGSGINYITRIKEDKKVEKVKEIMKSIPAGYRELEINEPFQVGDQWFKFSGADSPKQETINNSSRGNTRKKWECYGNEWTVIRRVTSQYPVGTRIKIISAGNSGTGSNGKTGVVTDKPAQHGVFSGHSKECFNVELDTNVYSSSNYTEVWSVWNNGTFEVIEENMKKFAIEAGNQYVFEAVEKWAKTVGYSFEGGFNHCKDALNVYGKETVILLGSNASSLYYGDKKYAKKEGYSLHTIADLETLEKGLKEEDIKAGDWVTCLAGGAEGQFTKGRVYKVRQVQSSSFDIEVDDRGSVTNGWNKKNFRKATPQEVEEAQKIKIGNEVVVFNKTGISLNEGTVTNTQLADIKKLMTMKVAGYPVYWDGKNVTVGCKVVPADVALKIFSKAGV